MIERNDTTIKPEIAAEKVLSEISVAMRLAEVWGSAVTGLDVDRSRESGVPLLRSFGAHWRTRA
jgi:hypothetical protein